MKELLLTLLVLLALLAPSESSARIPRSAAVRRAFMHAHPCPGGPDAGIKKRCRGFVIDHITALKCGGADAVTNMQWQTTSEAKRKDRCELRCKPCRPSMN